MSKERQVGARIIIPIRFSWILKFGDQFWEPTTTNILSQNGIQDIMHLGIIFSLIFADMGTKLGRIIDQILIPKRIEQKDAKKKDTHMARKTPHERF